MGWIRQRDLEKLAAAELTYGERGATRHALPDGYRHVSRRECIGDGQATFDRAVEALLGWHMHRGAGLVVVSAPPTATLDAVVVMRLGPPLLGVTVPCRVVYVEDEPDRRGFAYGTLPGHPEAGEEAFIIEKTPDAQIYLLIHAFSRPATLPARMGGPVARAVQNLITDRYIRALRRVAQG
jgi:uncharacterized protein (UPF0548 family)